MSDNTPVPIQQLEIGTRISEVSDLLGGRKVAAKAAGVSEDMLYRYIRGESRPSLEAIARLAVAAGVYLDWIATGVGPKLKAELVGLVDVNVPQPLVQPTCSCQDTLGNPVDLDEFVFIPRYNLKAAAGHGAATEGEAPVFSMAFRKYWISNYLHAAPHDLSVLSVKGDSMEGVLNNRDVILINHADNNADSGLFVLRVDGNLVVKRVQRVPGGKLGIFSANDAYPPFEVDMNKQTADFAVIGRVVWFGRQI